MGVLNEKRCKTPNYSDYETFVQKIGIKIEYYDPATMDELAIVINSCKLFVGVPSGIMVIAFALKVPILLGRPPCDSEYAMVKTLPNHFSNITVEDNN
jgi:ADP-heptose:LPS heptosyltransferase